MKRILPCLAVMMGCLAMPVAHAVEPLSEDELAGVVGFQGIAIGLEYGVNTDAAGNPLGSLNCTTSTNCRFAWNIAARTDVWTVLKDSWMSLSIPVLNIGVQPQMGTLGSSTAYYDPSRFMGYNSAGTAICLLPSGDCTNFTTSGIGLLPGLKLSYPAASYNSLSYDPGTGISSGYNSLGLGLTVGRMSLEFGATAYLSDVNTKSFLGMKIADNNGGVNSFAKMAIGGAAYVYGF